MARKKHKYTAKEKKALAEKLSYSRDIYSRREGDMPEVKAALEFFQDKLIKEYMVNRHKPKYRKAVRTLILDLFFAYQVDPTMYLTYSRSPNDYTKARKFGAMYLSYDVVLKVVDYLERQDYIEHHIGVYNNKTRKGRRSRIRATEKLNTILSQNFNLEIGQYCWISDENKGAVELKDQNDTALDYEDTPETLRMKENLRAVNTVLESHAILLHISDEDYRTLFKRMQEHTSNAAIDFTRKVLKRVFNKGSWVQGGRFYGAWWMNIPREYRQFIRLNDEPVVECDYSGLHINMLYAIEGLPIPPGDVYHLPDPEYPDPPDEALPEDSQEKQQYKIFREFVKQLLLVMINSVSREKAWGGINKAVHGKPFERNEKIHWTKPRVTLPKELPGTDQEYIYPLMDALARKHEKIQEYFYQDMGIWLQNEDSWISEQILVHFSKKGHAILPMHDSFIVHHSLEKELKECMENAFKERYKTEINVDLKYNSIEMYNTVDLEGPTEYNLSSSTVLTDRITHSIYYKLLNQFNKYKDNIISQGVDD